MRVPKGVIDDVVEEARNEGAVMLRSGRTRRPPRPRRPPPPPSRLRYEARNPPLSIRLPLEAKRRLEGKAGAERLSLSGWVKRRLVQEMDGEQAAYARGRAEGLQRGDALGYTRGRAEGFRQGRELASLMSREEGAKQGRLQGRAEGFLAGMIASVAALKERPWQTPDLTPLARELVTQPGVAQGVREILAQSGRAEKFDELMRAAQGGRG